MKNVKKILLFIILSIIVCSFVFVHIALKKEGIIAFKGFDRKDVPNYLLHVIDESKMEETMSINTSYDVTVNFEKVGKSDYYNVYNSQDEAKTVFLNEKYEFEEDIKNEFYTEKDFSIVNNNGKMEVYNRKKLLSSIMLSDDGNNQFELVLFNAGKSILFIGRKKYFVIKNIDEAQIEEVIFDEIINSENIKIYRNKNLDKIFLSSYSGERESTIYELKPLAKEKNIRKITLLQYLPEIFEVEESLGFIVYGALRTNKIEVVNINTGEIMHEIVLKENVSEIREKIVKNEKYYIVMNQKLINITDGKIEEEFQFFIGNCIVSQDKQYLYINTESKDFLLNKIIKYNIEKHTIERELVLEKMMIGASKYENENSGIHKFIYTKNNQLIVLSGTSLMYPDHKHIWR